MSVPKFVIQSVRLSKPGQRFMGLVSFAYEPSSFYPVKIKNDWKDSDGEWKSSLVAEIEGADRVRVNNAFVRQSEKGEYYCSAQGLDIPWDLAVAVGRAAHEQLDRMWREEQGTLEESGAA